MRFGLTKHLERRFAPDCVVVDAVWRELVSDGWSLLIKEETGKFLKVSLFRLLCTAKNTGFYWRFFAEFPTQWNREFWERIREFNIGNRVVNLLEQNAAQGSS